MHSSNKQLILSLSQQLDAVFHLQQQKQEFFPKCFKMAKGSRISEALTRTMLKKYKFLNLFWLVHFPLVVPMQFQHINTHYCHMRRSS